MVMLPEHTATTEVRPQVVLLCAAGAQAELHSSIVLKAFLKLSSRKA